MSDTPETDSQIRTFTSVTKYGKHFENKTGTVSLEFARRLERERNEWQRKFYEAHRQRDILLNALNRISQSLTYAKRHAGKRID